MNVRLQKILSQAGIASRRAAETLIAEGRVTVNGHAVREMGLKADPAVDDIRVDGRRVKAARRHRYILLNKPVGFVTTRSDPQRRPTVIDLLDGVREYVYPVGRLDYDTEGLLLLTNDGRLQARIADPRHKLAKTYWVQVEGEASDAQLARLRAGVELNDGPTLPAEARRIETPELWERDPPVRFRKSVPTCWLELVIREGRNRQVRRMTAAVGLPTLRLVRVRIGPWGLDGLAPGEWKEVPARL